MTELKRKGITQKIFLAQKNVDDKSGYTNALVTVSDEIDNDAANREDFVGNENIIANIFTELGNSAGILYSTQCLLPITDVVYYADSTTNITIKDNREVWKGASLTNDNIFYVPVVQNSQKLTLNTYVDNDTDGTTNIEPIIPSYLNTTFYLGTFNQQNEKITMNLISWAYTVLNNGYDIDFLNIYTMNVNNFSDKIYTNNQTTLNHYIYFYQNNIVFCVAKVIEQGSDSGGSYIKLQILTLYNKPTSGTISYTHKIVANSDTIKNIITHLVTYWQYLITSQIDSINNLIEKANDDNDQLKVLQAILTIINSWFNLTDAVKYSSIGLTNLSNNFSKRNTDIDARVNNINSKCNNNIVSYVNGLLSDINNNIVLRLRKRGGTLNNVYRKILALVAEIDKLQSDSKTLQYYSNQFVVKELLDGASDSKVVYVKDVNGLNKNDEVYIISDDKSLKEIKTIIVDITDYNRMKQNVVSLEQEYELVKKLTLANSIPSLFLPNDNARLAKQLV